MQRFVGPGGRCGKHQRVWAAGRGFPVSFYRIVWKRIGGAKRGSSDSCGMPAWLVWAQDYGGLCATLLESSMGRDHDFLFLIC